MKPNTVLLMIVCLSGIALLTTPVTAAPGSQNYISLHGDQPVWTGNQYTWTAAGQVYGKLEGTITWYETGYKSPLSTNKQQVYYAVANGDLNLINGTVIHWQLGTGDIPFTKKTKVISGSILQYNLQGKLYSDGVYITDFSSIAKGTTTDIIIPY